MKLTLVKKVEEAPGTKSFFWQSEKPLKYLAGQYYYFTLKKLNYPDARGATRHFTIANSPTESNTFMFTTRIRKESGYKKTLDELQIGAEIDATGPNGTFILDEKETGSHIFIAGGIGITPFRSMIKYSIEKALNIPMYLIYSNSDSNFTYKKELDSWQKENDFLKISYFDSSVSGHLDIKKLSSLFPIYDILHTTFWLVGPPAFMDAVEKILTEMKIPSGKILTEKFTGY